MNFNFRVWSRWVYHLSFALLVAGLILSLILLPDLRIISLLIIVLTVLLWFYLIKREWDAFALKIKELFKDYDCKVTYSILGGTTFLMDKAFPFTKKFLRPSLGASIIYKNTRLRINFLYFNPRINPLIMGPGYDYELLILGFESTALTNELYASGFKEKGLPDNVKLLINDSINSYYIKNEEYVKNPELFITNLFNVMDKYLQ